jgi:RpiR family carbohydrate utilization transcriptional regulator
MTFPANNILRHLDDNLSSMNKSEKKVAAHVLSDPQAATTSSIATLAQAAGVSEPSVNRFCKKFGATGFPDFKLKLAQSLVGGGVRYLSQNVSLDDDVDAYTTKIVESSIVSLTQLRAALSRSQINAAVDKLIQAKRIYFFGLGASSSIARDAEYKFFRFNLPVCFYDDVLMQRMLASSGSTGDVFFIISNTGRTRELVDVASLASENGATVIGLTATGSPLAEVATVSIDIDLPENTDDYMPMTSRLVHMVALDILATGVTLRRGPEFQPHLKKIKDSLKPTRYPKQDD